jgi:[acyl-carrier-protein] S-malonyltransferase
MIGFVFPGQGSQHRGMGQFLYNEFKVAKEIFENASDVLSIDFKKLCFDGSDQDLALTENTQPSLLLVSTVYQTIFTEILGIKPTITSGHSIGEYASFVLAKSMDFSTALKAVRLRGMEMQKASPVGKGAMTAVLGLSDEQVEKLCQWAQTKAGKPLSPANYNCPGQVVISGNVDAMNMATKELKPQELWPEQTPRPKFIALNVSAPFHCELMRPAEEAMSNFFRTAVIQKAHLPIVQNYTGKIHQSPEELKENIIKQVTGSVRWTQCVQTMKAHGVTHWIECGAGKVLSGLIKKIDSQASSVFNVNSMDELKTLEKSF